MLGVQHILLLNSHNDDPNNNDEDESKRYNATVVDMASSLWMDMNSAYRNEDGNGS